VKDEILLLEILQKNDRHCEVSGNRDRDSGAAVVGDLGGLVAIAATLLDSTAIAPHLYMPSRPQPLPNLVAQFNGPLQVGIELKGLIEGIEGILRATGFVVGFPQVGIS
jgi:hypothetical protein